MSNSRIPGIVGSSRLPPVIRAGTNCTAPTYSPGIDFTSFGQIPSGLARTKVLNVPYIAQPTPITCQATCLKMAATYLGQVKGISSPADAFSIEKIWQEINKGKERPSRFRNAHANMAWWLNRYFAPPSYAVHSPKAVEDAIETVILSIDLGYPLLASTNHSRTSGHIILILGYVGYTPGVCDPGLRFVCHDPYGKFNPQLGSDDYGANRFNGGMSLACGGEMGPGKGVLYNVDGIRRTKGGTRFSLISITQ